eukprot:scaffold529_cov308-Pinguiococcus_pyrenoidosus.AAC.20
MMLAFPPFPPKQVLLSQAHRHRALLLLKQFLELGAWAVNLALSVGIFPYVLKLLKSPAPELCPVLVAIWARILCFDKSCQLDLVKPQDDHPLRYFLTQLRWPPTPSPDQSSPRAAVLQLPSKEDLQARLCAAFSLAQIMDGHRVGACSVQSGSPVHPGRGSREVFSLSLCRSRDVHAEPSPHRSLGDAPCPVHRGPCVQYLVLPKDTPHSPSIDASLGAAAGVALHLHQPPLSLQCEVADLLPPHEYTNQALQRSVRARGRLDVDALLAAVRKKEPCT